MKKVETWIADDGEEFSTEEECYAYEHRLDGVWGAALFLDDDFNVIENDLEQIYDRFQYIVILDAEKAPQLFWAIWNYEHCFIYPENYSDGTLLKWDGGDETYINLVRQSEKILDELRSVTKAVSSLG